MLNEILIAIICSLFFYILGSFPTSYVLGKKIVKINILDKDSHHSGLSNIYNLISIPKPVIGVIDFFIHDKVLDQFRKSVSNVIEVTIENRDTLPDEITEIIIKECNK